jgi:uncharacterized protein (DUF3084 family)
MDLVIRDKNIELLQLQIQDRKKLLLEKYKTINKIAQENEFLGDVANDYERYYNYIVEQKKQQIIAYENLLAYLGNLILNTALTTSSIENAKNQQKEILNKINYIKREINEIIYK